MISQKKACQENTERGIRLTIRRLHLDSLSGNPYIGFEGFQGGHLTLSFIHPLKTYLLRIHGIANTCAGLLGHRDIIGLGVMSTLKESTGPQQRQTLNMFKMKCDKGGRGGKIKGPSELR